MLSLTAHIQGTADGLAARRVGETGEIDAAKAVKEGLQGEAAAALLAATGALPGDLLLLAAGPEATVNRREICGYSGDQKGASTCTNQSI